jgi:hypothetical protein
MADLAAETTWRQLCKIAQQLCGTANIELEPYAHALCVEVACACGSRREAVGSRWATTPDCERCGKAMQWVRETCRGRLTPNDLDQLRLADELLLATGIPERGAMFVARTPGKPPLRLVLA